LNYDKTKINGKDFVFEASFDALFYDIFLLLHRNFEMIDISDITIGLEHNGRRNFTRATYRAIFDKLKAQKYVPGWLHSRLFKMDPSYFTSEGNFLMFHIDRDA
jgi:hypothetical protein